MRAFTLLRRARKVFLSSTSEDLAAWRARVAAVLEEEGLVVVDQPRMPAMAASAAQGSAAMVDGCGVLAGIYARRYGTVHDGQSITEHEYDAAAAQKIPRLAFMLRDDAPWPAELIEEEPGATRLRELKQRIRADVIVAEFSTLEELLDAVRAASRQYLQRARQRARRNAALLALSAIAALVLFALALLRVSARPDFSYAILENVPMPPQGASAIALDPVTGVLATGDDDGNVYLWEWAGDRMTKRKIARARGVVKELAFSPRGDRLLAIGLGKGDQPAHVISWSMPGLRGVFDVPVEARSLAAEHRGSGAAVGMEDGRILVLDERGRTRSAYSLSSLPRGDGRVIAVDFAEDDRHLAAATINGVFVMIDTATSAVTFHEDFLDAGHAVHMMGNDRIVMSGMRQRGTSQIFQVWEHDASRTNLMAQSDNVFSDLVSVSRSDLLTADWNGQLALWDLRERSKLGEASIRDTDGESVITGLAYDRRRGMVYAATENHVAAWRLEWWSVFGIRTPDWLR